LETGRTAYRGALSGNLNGNSLFALQEETSQTELSGMLQEDTLVDLLEARLQQTPDERLDSGTHPDFSAHARSYSEATQGRWHPANYAIPMRHASLWRHILENSCLNGRDDLNIFGVGIGANVLNGSQLYIAEPIEVLGLMAKRGLVHYLEIKDSVVERAREFNETGKMSMPAILGPEGILTEHVEDIRASLLRNFPPRQLLKRRLLLREHVRDAKWALQRMIVGGISMRGMTVFSGTNSSSRLQLTYKEDVANRFEAESGDLLFQELPIASSDLSLALLVMPYISLEPGPLTALATVRFARTVRPGGLLAISEWREEPFIEATTLTALGFKCTKVVPAVENDQIVCIWKRPKQDSQFAEDMFESAERIVKKSQ
jgi:hypothetical protein